MVFGQKPMLARAVTQLPQPNALSGGCVYEPKLDGYRALLHVTDDGCRVQSRGGHDITTAFSDVADAAAEQLPAGVVVDGELVVWGDGGLDFSELQRRMASGRRRRMPASFVAFDVLEANATDVRGFPLRRRREVLELLLGDARPPLQLGAQTDDPAVAETWMADYAANPVGIEGVVVKGRDSTYRPGRREWLKLRVRDTVEVVVGAVTGSATAPGRLVLGTMRDGELAVVGSTSDLTTQQRTTVAPHLREANADHPWPAEISEGRLGHFSKDKVALVRVEPTLVVEVSADNSFDRGRWRHITTFVRARPDLTPDEIAGL